MANTFIVKFADETSRSKFYRVLKARVPGMRVEFGEVLPDLIVYDISEDELKRVDRIAGTNARFIADFKHNLFV